MPGDYPLMPGDYPRFTGHPIHATGVPEIHVQEIQTTRYVVDVEMWSEGDIVSMRVDYSDGTRKEMVAPAVTATGSFQ